MPVLHFDDQHFPLPAGTIRIGAGSGADLPLPAADPSLGVLALIDEGPAGRRTIRRAGPQAEVRVNGVVLGAEPTPLMHGDRLQIGGVELRYADDAKAGATQFVSASEIAALAGSRRAGGAQPTAASGGRLVSLVDGKEYTVPSSGLVIGRDASCDVVVGQSEVSRRHAEICPSEQGYVVRDMSANGVFVNGDRVQGSQRLARADVLRVGSEEFRFYADPLVGAARAAKEAPAVPVPTLAPVPAHASLVSPPTPRAMPAAEDPRPPLATLESINEGPGKGARYPLRTPLAHVGRGPHNDVRLGDESVSETHAKLQRRDDGWYVVDMGSTNGTYVGGTRITGERRLDGSPDVRFGGVKMRFSVAEGSASEAASKGTRPIASVERTRPSAAPPPEAVRTDVPRGGISRWVWLAALVAVAATAFFLLQGRA